MKRWTHVRSDTKVKAVYSLEQMLENNAKIFDSDAYASHTAEDVVRKTSIEEFKKGLSDEDMMILQMRAEGKALGDIASTLGLKSPSAITKRIAKIAQRFREEVD